MPIATHLFHTCTVQRPTKVLDPYNNETLVWADYLTGVACRLVSKQQRVLVSEMQQFVTTTALLLLVGAEIDVVADDRITNVVFEDGTTDAGPYKVGGVLPRRGMALHHKSLNLEQIT